MKYISLFSSAGIGTYNLKKMGLECIATNELLKKRMDIQRYNKVCKNEEQYLEGSIENPEIIKKLDNLIKKYSKGNLDIIFATPPCQGMSVINHKKKDELNRNSLIIKSIELILKHKPKYFIFENVRSFLKTTCFYEGKNIKISQAIKQALSSEYEIENEILNFKYFGANSSRTRTIVIGVRKDLEIPPLILFPDYSKPKTLKQIIGKLPELKKMGEINNADILHNFKKYNPIMRNWISNLSEGQSAFDNADKNKIPHHFKNGKKIYNKNLNGDKYKRQYWNQTAPCIHTRNDILSSQNTIHPVDDRVFSIREISMLQNIPKNFKWFKHSYKKINEYNHSEKEQLLKSNEMNIRNCIGEAVPPIIFQKIINKINFYTKYYNNIRKIEKQNKNKKSNSAYYTSTELLKYCFEILPEIRKKNINILEPSVGAGSLIPILLEKYKDKNINLHVNDIDYELLHKIKFDYKKIFKKIRIIKTYKNYIDLNYKIKFDLIITNPPFHKSKEWNEYLPALFMKKSLAEAENIVYILPKFFLHNSGYSKIRNLLMNKQISNIIDFGEKGFKNIKIETIAISIRSKTKTKKHKIKIFDAINKIKYVVNQDYVINNEFPTWLIYRNDLFDKIFKNLNREIIKNIWRDRTITTKNRTNKGITLLKPSDLHENRIKVKSNLKINDFSEKYFEKIISKELLIAPNMTYNIRCGIKPVGMAIDGSFAIVETKEKLNNDQIKYWSSEEFRKYYEVVQNKSRRTINLNNIIKFYLGFLEKGNKHGIRY